MEVEERQRRRARGRAEWERKLRVTASAVLVVTLTIVGLGAGGVAVIAFDVGGPNGLPLLLLAACPLATLGFIAAVYYLGVVAHPAELPGRDEAPPPTRPSMFGDGDGLRVAANVAILVLVGVALTLLCVLVAALKAS